MTEIVYRLVRENDSWKIENINKSDLFETVEKACADISKRLKAEKERNKKYIEDISKSFSGW